MLIFLCSYFLLNRIKIENYLYSLIDKILQFRLNSNCTQNALKCTLSMN